ncbi:Leucine-rich repeat-containing protein 69 [Labeo rohita]|uniref:Leucine-rich repeat-containing protein 69 n=1 Tax=Labeo rohita TaxID=84645 RepID=A0ABQ8LQ50_LABRO|nr:Leucine-rich repeat-containing protein 69 [Labeo rohita]
METCEKFKLTIHATCQMANDLIIKALKTKSNSLNLSSRKITHLPEVFARLTWIVILKLNNNYLSSLPSELMCLQKLTELNLGNNVLEEIPSVLKHLHCLNKLYLYGNKISHLPPEGALGWKNLKILDVAGNCLSVFPVGFLTLEELFFEGNNLVPFTLMESIQEKEVLSLKDMLSHWGQCALCSQPFLTTWLECVQFINTRKHMGMKSSQSVPVRVLLCSYDCFNRDDHQYYGLVRL